MPGSNSPSNKVASLLPVKTTTRSAPAYKETGRYMLTYGFLWMEVYTCHCAFVTWQLKRCPRISQARISRLIAQKGRALYNIFPLSTSHTVTVRSAPPTATLPPPSSLLHAPRRIVFSYPAGAPCSTRCTRAGDGENGRTSWMIVWEEREGDRMKAPDGESASDVGVSVCPPRVYTCAILRRSYTWKGLSTLRARRERTTGCARGSHYPAHR